MQHTTQTRSLPQPLLAASFDKALHGIARSAQEPVIPALVNVHSELMAFQLSAHLRTVTLLTELVSLAGDGSYEGDYR